MGVRWSFGKRFLGVVIVVCDSLLDVAAGDEVGNGIFIAWDVVEFDGDVVGDKKVGDFLE